MSNAQITTYARQLASIMQEVSEANERAKDILASAKDAGLKPKRIRKLARELCMDPSKREELYEEERQLDLLRDACGLTGVLEAAE